MVALSRQSRESLILGKLCASLMVWLLGSLKSILNWRLPSFLCTSTTGLAHGLVDLCMAPISNISWRFFLTSSCWWGGILLYLSLKSVLLLSLISCWTKEVLPNSFMFRANKCWYSSRSFLTEHCCCSVYDSIPVRSNFSKNLWHSFVLLFGWLFWLTLFGDVFCDLFTYISPF